MPPREQFRYHRLIAPASARVPLNTVAVDAPSVRKPVCASAPVGSEPLRRSMREQTAGEICTWGAALAILQLTAQVLMLVPACCLMNILEMSAMPFPLQLFFIR